MVIEFAEGGELFSFVQAGNGAAITKAAIAQTVEGLAYLHDGKFAAYPCALVERDRPFFFVFFFATMTDEPA